MSVTEKRDTLYPLVYPQAIKYWKEQHAHHWLSDETPLGDDVQDYNHKLTEAERNLVTQIFRLFTKSDEEINNCYHQHYKRIFKAPEVQMMLGAFSEWESIHVMAYSHLLKTLGLPDTEFQAFREYEEMKAKMDWIGDFNPYSPIEVAEALAAFSGAIEGMSLFASFAILLNFTRFNKLKGMGDIINWSVRDESLHCEGIAWLFKTYVEEHPDIDRKELADRIATVFVEAVRNEDAFIDLAFALGPVEGLTAGEMKQYIRFIADFRLRQLGQKPLFGIEQNPLPWLAEQLNGQEFGNFFETKVTEYSKGQTEGDWDNAFEF